MRSALWRNRDFLRLWSAQSVSELGSQVTALALPLAAIFVVHASTFEVAALNVVDFLPFALFSLPAGVWVDRLRRRPLMIAADYGRAVALVSIPLAYATHALTLPQLFAVGFVTGTLTVFFDVSYQSILPTLVDRSQLGDANSKLETTNSGAQLAGPGIAGVLVGALTAPYAIALDAASFVGSALFLGGIRAVEDTVDLVRRRMRTEIAEGVRYLVRHPLMRPMMLWVALSNFFGTVITSILILFAVRGLHLHAATIGLVISLANVGTLLGAVTGPRVSRRIGLGPALLAYAALGSTSSLLIPWARDGYAIPLLVAARGLFGFCAIGANVNGISLVQAITPDRMLGRINASRRFVVWGVIPFGGLLGGAIAAEFGLRTALWVGAIGQLVSFLPLLPSPLKGVRTIADAEAMVIGPVGGSVST